MNNVKLLPLPEPKFGEWMRGIYASEDNPQRDGMYVRTVLRSGSVNPGKHYELTDGKGGFWQYPVKSTERIARACIEAYREAKADDVEAVAWRRRHPNEDDPSGWHGWITSDKKPKQELAGSEYQPLYTHPAPDDVARLAEAAATALRYIPKPTGSNVERDWKKKQARDELADALAPFITAQQEASHD